MKKASIITILDNTNFGTYLQALALCTKIKSLGLNVEIINYYRPFMTSSAIIKEELKRINIKSLYHLLYNIPQIIKLKNKNHKFLNKYISFTPLEYHSYKELCTNPPQTDILITGSDQVWNSYYNHGIDESFFLNFGEKKIPRIAYASSIGMKEIPKEEKKRTKELLSNYQAISVREGEAKELLTKLGINDIEVVLDPTLLLNKEEWYQYGSKNFTKKEKYILIYNVETQKQIDLIAQYATEIAQKRQYKIYYITYNSRLKKPAFVDKIFGFATPEQFISLLQHADFVIVSSFHGTAFSINFNKEFLSISAAKFNSRVNNLLRICRLENRLVSDNSYQLNDMIPIDYTEVNYLLNIERNKSIAFLTNTLKKQIKEL